MRPPRWPEILARYIRDASDQEFCWGVSDCCSFTRGAILAVGGPDLGDGWAGTYGDEDGARDAILSLGRDLEFAVEATCRRVGLVEVATPFASRGDLLVLRDRMLIGGMPLAAVCEGRYAVTTAKRGLIRLPMRVVVRAWKIE